MRSLKKLKFDIGMSIRGYRIKNKYPQSRLAKAVAHESDNYISQLEGGFCNPNIETLHKIATELGVDVVDLLRISSKEPRMERRRGRPKKRLQK